MLWWIDNTSAQAAMVKAGSPTVSMGRLALQAHAMLTALRCRVWVEHVPSGDNPADVLSRAGLDDPAVHHACATGLWTFRDPVAPSCFERLSFGALWGWALAY